jgi:hypothetical protein
MRIHIMLEEVFIHKEYAIQNVNPTEEEAPEPCAVV